MYVIEPASHDSAVLHVSCDEISIRDLMKSSGEGKGLGSCGCLDLKKGGHENRNE